MKKNLFQFTEENKSGFIFRWTTNHYEYCRDNKIFLEHRGKKIYKERNVFTFNKGEAIKIDDNVVVEDVQKEFSCQWNLKPFNTTLKIPVIWHDVGNGNNVVLKDGITIGNGAVIAANSVVT